jgi:hypothetical protein
VRRGVQRDVVMVTCTMWLLPLPNGLIRREVRLGVQCSKLLTRLECGHSIFISQVLVLL